MTNYPVNWKTKRLEEVSDVIDPHPSHRAPAIDPNGIPFVGIGDVREDGIADFRRARLVSPKILSKHAERYSLETDLIGLGRVASVGKVVKLPKGDIPYTISPTLAVISPREISFDFLYYALQTPQIQNQLSGLKQGSGRQSVGILKLRKVVVPFPPLDEQRKIVELLEDHMSRLDAALTDVKQAKIKAAQFRRSLLQAAFTGYFGSDGTRLMTELPQGWTRTTIGEVCEKPKYGWTTSASESGQIRLLRTTDLTRGPLTWESVPFCKESPKNFADFEVHKNDIFISRAGSVGVSVLVKEVPFASVFASYLIRLRPTNKVNAKFLALFLQSPNYWDQVLELSSGIALANINATKIQSMSLPLPPLPEQHKIVEILEDHLSRLDASIVLADAMEKQSAGLRRSLLQAAFTGQLTKEVASV